MGFLDNSGDIILDAVLTDTGRFRLARGDGSFRVAKFALGDDEVNYQLYDSTHASGSAYYDISILQTPVLEAFTNNTSTMKSKLITISRTNLLYLPIIKLNVNGTSHDLVNRSAKHSKGLHVIAVDKETVELDTLADDAGVLNGYEVGGTNTIIGFDQGIDNIAAVKTIKIDPDLQETQYIVQIDHRLGMIAAAGSDTVASYSFLDDDNIATYYFTMGTDATNSGYVSSIAAADNNRSALAGARGSRLQFAIKASESLQNSTFYFDKLGTLSTSGDFGVSGRVHYQIDTTIRIMGATTGYGLELPVRFIKYKSG